MPSPAGAGNPGAKDAPAGRVATNDRAAGRDTLTVTDNRTGTTYELPIENGAIPAAALRDIKTQPDDFGLMSYDPAFTNTAHCTSPAATRSSSSPSTARTSRSPPSSSTASFRHAGRTSRGPSTPRIPPSCTRT